MSRLVLALGVGVPALAAAAVSVHGCGSQAAPADRDAATTTVSPLLAAARGAIKHVVVIMQENRSFDHYFGTFPGADGIPMGAGVPTVCNDNPKSHTCQKPYHDVHDENYGGPHGHMAYDTSVAGGAMSGFVTATQTGTFCSATSIVPGCAPPIIDVMGYHTDGEIPNYWAYAKNFVLQDHMFEPVTSYSLPDHLYMVSAWSAQCTPPSDPTHCVDDLGTRYQPIGTSPTPEYAWTDITYLLHAKSVTWNYFVTSGYEPDCDDGSIANCPKVFQSYDRPSYWNILPWFDDVKLDNEVANVQDTTHFYTNLKAGSLASVTWLIPSWIVSEHPPALVSRGQAYVTEIVNSIMQSPFWESTVIFLTWDDWGGFYDHVNPVRVDQNGYGLRVPGLTISPWVKKGLIDKQLLSHDAYLKFIEDVFLDGQRLDPATDGRGDSRPTVREGVAKLGDLLDEFDFTQKPLPPLVLDVCPKGVDTIYGKGGPCKP